MGKVVYLGLCLLGCLILGSSSTPVEGPHAKGEMPPSGKSEESKENKIPVAAKEPHVMGDMLPSGKSEESKENKIPVAANEPHVMGEMLSSGKSEESKENKSPAAAAANVANDDQVNPRSSCPPWAYQFRRNCYEYFPQPQPWYSAEFRCQKLRPGGHLVSFSSLNEEKMVSTFINSRDSTTNYVWTGFNAARDYNSLIWEWSDGFPYNSGSPLWDNRIPRSTLSSLECLLLINVRNLSDRSRWTEQNCDVSYPYVCKYKVDN